MPTFAEYIERLSAASPHTPGSHNYRNRWARLLTEGDSGARRPDEPTVSEFRAFIAAARENRARRHNGRDPELDLLMIRLHTETACRRRTACA